MIECRRAVCLRALFHAATAVATHDAQALDAPAHIRPEWREIAREAADSEHADEARLELDARILRAQEARERQLQVGLLQRRVTCCDAARHLGGSACRNIFRTVRGFFVAVQQRCGLHCARQEKRAEKERQNRDKMQRAMQCQVGGPCTEWYLT